MKSLVIFDLDGTLLNTIDDLGAAVNHALASMGYPPHSMTACRQMVGNGVRKLIERALPDDARGIDVQNEMLRRFKDYYNSHCADATVPYPGITQLLAELSSRGINLAVASNKYQEAVTKIIGHFFPDANWRAVAGHVEGVRPKPDPSVLFGVLAQCPTPKSEVLYVGDSGVDIETARRACVESAGVTWGFRSAAELRAHYADHIVSDPDDIIALTL